MVTDGMKLTRIEKVALDQLLAHLGLSEHENAQPTRTRKAPRTRLWTRAMRAEAARRMRAYWRTKRSK